MTTDSCPLQNVGTHERIVSAMLGTLLLGSGLRHRSLFRLAGAGALFYRAFSGNCKLYESLEINTNEASEDATTEIGGA